jgi:hypothetical protein
MWIRRKTEFWKENFPLYVNKHGSPLGYHSMGSFFNLVCIIINTEGRNCTSKQSWRWYLLVSNYESNRIINHRKVKRTTRVYILKVSQWLIRTLATGNVWVRILSNNKSHWSARRFFCVQGTVKLAWDPCETAAWNVAHSAVWVSQFQASGLNYCKSLAVTAFYGQSRQTNRSCI